MTEERPKSRTLSLSNQIEPGIRVTKPGLLNILKVLKILKILKILIDNACGGLASAAAIMGD